MTVARLQSVVVAILTIGIRQFRMLDEQSGACELYRKNGKPTMPRACWYCKGKNGHGDYFTYALDGDIVANNDDDGIVLMFCSNGIWEVYKSRPETFTATAEKSPRGWGRI